MPDILLSRRTLMEASVASVLTTGAGTALAQNKRAVELQYHHFAPLVGERFRIAGRAPSGALHELVLQRVDRLADGAGAPRREPNFRLLFECAGAGVAQDTWQLEHPVLGQHAVFLSPNDPEGRVVEALFVRL